MAAANILQLLGAVRFLITVANNFLRLSQNKKECRKLELRVETLEALIGWQTPCWSIVQQQQPWLEALVSTALREANGLTNSYRKGTVCFLVRTGRSMTQPFRDHRNRFDSYCALLISINACQLMAQAGPLTAPLLVRVEGKEGGATPDGGCAFQGRRGSYGGCLLLTAFRPTMRRQMMAKRQVKIVVSASN